MRQQLYFLLRLFKLVYFGLTRPKFRAHILRMISDQERREHGERVPFVRVIRRRQVHHGFVGF